MIVLICSDQGSDRYLMHVPSMFTFHSLDDTTVQSKRLDFGRSVFFLRCAVRLPATTSS